ncbi:MAG: hypothetical protein AB8I08_27300 [Sandaracinaceae bacterium]
MGSNRTRGVAALLFVLTVTAGAAFAQNSTPDCVEVEGVSRWGAAAFNHWVTVNNQCARPVHCIVRTDVSPDSHALDVPAGERREVLTFRGSPARAFTPRVQCDER